MQLLRSLVMRRSAPRPPAWRIGARVSRHGFAASALLLAALLPAVADLASAQAPQPASPKGNTVRITADQMHQLEIAKVEAAVFRAEKQAIGQIAFNEDASTLVLTPFSGRVTRLIAKIGDAVKRGDPLFEIDSPEVVQAQTDLIAAVQGRRQEQVPARARQADLRSADRPLCRQSHLAA